VSSVVGCRKSSPASLRLDHLIAGTAIANVMQVSSAQSQPRRPRTISVTVHVAVLGTVAAAPMADALCATSGPFARLAAAMHLLCAPVKTLVALTPGVILRRLRAK